MDIFVLILVMWHLDSSSIKVLVLGDSHLKHVRRLLSRSDFEMITKSISGLKWVDRFDERLSVFALLLSHDMQSLLSQADALLFSIGTNSVRTMRATEIIDQVRDVVHLVRQNYPHLNGHGKVSISSTFACSKTTRRFQQPTALLWNINLYNEKLNLLSSEIDFNVVDYPISCSHLANDGMHVHQRFRHRLLDSIIGHFNRIVPLLASTRQTILNPNQASGTVTASIHEQSSHSSNRSQAVTSRRRQERRQYSIRRTLHDP